MITQVKPKRARSMNPLIGTATRYKIVSGVVAPRFGGMLLSGYKGYGRVCRRWVSSGAGTEGLSRVDGGCP